MRGLSAHRHDARTAARSPENLSFFARFHACRRTLRGIAKLDRSRATTAAEPGSTSAPTRAPHVNRVLAVAMGLLLLAACETAGHGAQPDPLSVSATQTSGDARSPLATATVQLVVVDGRQYVRLEHFAVRARSLGADGAQTVLEFTPADVARAHAVLANLPAGELELVVSADGFAPRTLAIANLEAGETRTLATLLAPAGDRALGVQYAKLGVRALDSDSTTPLAGVELRIRRSITGSSPATSFTARESTQSERVRTDGAGRAEFDVVRGATYEILARRTSLFVRRVAFDVAASGALAELPIVFQPNGTVAGQLTSRVPVDFTQYALEFVTRTPCASASDNEEFWWSDPASDDDEQDLHVKSTSRHVSVAADGSFDAGLLPAGVTDARLLRARDVDATRARRDSALETWTRLVDPGEQSWSFDVGAHVPGTLALACALHGVRADEVIVELVDAAARFTLARLTLDADGRAPGTSVQPGSCRVRVCARDGSWVWSAPDELHVAARTTTHAEYDVTIGTGTIMLVDSATHEHLSGVRVRVRGSSAAFESRHTTGSRGELTLRRPAGRYHVSIDDARWADVSFDWTETGPAVSELAVRRLRP